MGNVKATPYVPPPSGRSGRSAIVRPVTVSVTVRRACQPGTGRRRRRPIPGGAADHRGTVPSPRSAKSVGWWEITSDDETVRVWDLAYGTTLHVTRGHTRPVQAIAADALDGHPIAVTAGDDRTQVWDLIDGARLTVIPVESCHGLAVHDRQVVLALSRGVIALDLHTGVLQARGQAFGRLPGVD